MESQLWSVIVPLGSGVLTPPTAQGCLWQQAGVPETPILKGLLCALQELLFTVTYFFHFFLRIHINSGKVPTHQKFAS